ncbi:MAG: Holliday junction resolvase RuvX [Flavobacteriales bacterium]|nr:Holliday junction resolvase RuvX [Flavobacteriales bacterium]MCC6938624.1 Holliday junction resolvase RuvX [Flavobacteriales bacterium]
MPRVIAIDHGSKRTGLAVTDTLRIIATALETVETTKVLDYLKAYVAKEKVDGFVIGLPTNLDGTATDGTAGAIAFTEQLKKAFPDKWVEQVDERFTSRMAQQTLRMSGKGRMARREKGQIDRISATIILQSWLSKH